VQRGEVGKKKDSSRAQRETHCDEMFVEAEHLANLLFTSDHEARAIGDGEVVIGVLAKDLTTGPSRRAMLA
jgi:hypothetical protein